jgi:plastocyanin
MTSTTLRTRVAALAAVSVIGLGVTACGSSTKTTSPPAKSTGTGSAGTTATATATAKVRIVNFTFTPNLVTVKVGGTVTWTQVDSVGHSVESTTGAWKTSNVLQPGQTFSHTFTKAGTYPYICGVHNYMMGTVKVVG